MKKRIKIDNAILSAVIIFTGVLYIYPSIYPADQRIDDLFDFLGLIAILKGTVLRMIARAHKKNNSSKSEELVTSGIYSVTRNPMYLGSFMIGAGFVWILWPWWLLPLFAVIFYLRFNKEMVKEEKMLSKVFGKKYDDYAKRVPRIFPTWKIMDKVKVRDIVKWDEMFITKEKNGLWAWPLLVVVLESFQEKMVYGYTSVPLTVLVFLAAAVMFWVSFALKYRFR